jgi:hypothetical protein
VSLIEELYVGAIDLIACGVRVKTNSRDELGCAVMPVMEAGMAIMFGMSSETISRPRAEA